MGRNIFKRIRRKKYERIELTGTLGNALRVLEVVPFESEDAREALYIISNYSHVIATNVRVKLASDPLKFVELSLDSQLLLKTLIKVQQEERERYEQLTKGKR